MQTAICARALAEAHVIKSVSFTSRFDSLWTLTISNISGQLWRVSCRRLPYALHVLGVCFCNVLPSQTISPQLQVSPASPNALLTWFQTVSQNFTSVSSVSFPTSALSFQHAQKDLGCGVQSAMDESMLCLLESQLTNVIVVHARVLSRNSRVEVETVDHECILRARSLLFTPSFSPLFFVRVDAALLVVGVLAETAPSSTVRPPAWSTEFAGDSKDMGSMTGKSEVPPKTSS